jgi:hypothetical protein
MDAETWMGAAEALEAGFIDEIIEAVPVPLEAAARAAVNLSQAPEWVRRTLSGEAATEDDPMPDLTGTQGGGGNGPTSDDPLQGREHERALARERDTAMRAERLRIVELGDLRDQVRALGIVAEEDLQAMHARWTEQGVSRDEAGREVLALGGRRAEPAGLPVGAPDPRATTVDDRAEKLVRGGTEAVLVKAFPSDREARQRAEGNELLGYTMRDLMAEFAATAGIQRRAFGTAEDYFTAILRHGRSPGDRRVNASLFTQSDSNFSALLANVAFKSIMRGWEEEPEAYPNYCRMVPMPDFKQAQFAGLSDWDNLPIVRAGAEYTYGEFSDRGETATLSTYGNLFAINRVAIVNDDLQAMTDVPRKMGRAARRTVGNLVYKVLTDPQTMTETGLTLFNSAHANTVSAAPPDTPQIEAMAEKMRLQKRSAESDAYIGPRPRHLVVSTGYEAEAIRAVRISTWVDLETAASGGQSLQANPSVVNTLSRFGLEVHEEPRLGTGTDYFLLADPNIYDAMIVGTLDGQDAPTILERDIFVVDGVMYKVRIDAVARILDYRSVVKSGATDD